MKNYPACEELISIMIWPQGYKTFSMLNLTEHEISNLIKTKMLKVKIFHAFKLLDVLFIMLINVKMPTIDNCWLFIIYEHDKIHAQLRLG